MDYKDLISYKEVLLLNSDYNPISVVSWRRAIVLIIKNKVKLISQRVIRLINYIKIPVYKLLSVKPTKNLVKKLGNYTCAYCGSFKDLTIDHILPISRGGQHTFSNLCCCCRKCNEEKGNRTPQEWGKIPYKPNYNPKSKLEIILKKSNVDEWKQYIYT